MTTWQAILNCVYYDDFETLERVLKIPHDNAYEASSRIAHEIGEQLYKPVKGFSGIAETIKYFVKNPYLEQQSFAEAVIRELLKKNEYLHKYADML